MVLLLQIVLVFVKLVTEFILVKITKKFKKEVKTKFHFKITEQNFIDLNQVQDLECKLQLYLYKNLDRNVLQNVDSFGSFQYIINSDLELTDLKLYDNSRETDGPVSQEVWNLYQIKELVNGQKVLVINELVRGKFKGGPVKDLYMDNVIHQNMTIKELQEQWEKFYNECLKIQQNYFLLQQLINLHKIDQQHLFVRELLSSGYPLNDIYNMTCSEAVRKILNNVKCDSQQQKDVKKDKQTDKLNSNKDVTALYEQVIEHRIGLDNNILQTCKDIKLIQQTLERICNKLDEIDKKIEKLEKINQK